MRTIPLRIIRAFQSLRPVLFETNRMGNGQRGNGLADVKQEHTSRRFRPGAMTYDPDRAPLCRGRARSGIDLAQHYSYAEQGLHRRVRHGVARVEHGAGERGRDQSGIREGVVDLRIGRGGSSAACAHSGGVGTSTAGASRGAPARGEGGPTPYGSDASGAAARVWGRRLWTWVSGGHSLHSERSFLIGHDRSNRP